ncbi:hypothetical protein GUITHDRAFT_156031 [Guillardia theta CCMP2712]|uniref:Uncharacterized protein n=1 Tax=Guillardia theta (strain CCMP2712) TaxID=905079 RepID=L1IB88_GUITC|nr:hypothetical protein GUITHDRAFT_156031 [Guillardia theta CCMP2712]EKX33493.1 hypothetical protein GUITHDRAFT_156031 [Guillardia theta CCMP2712]|eukprot:XP_005820473.1 hypothetical protein GUITHDRAFT_156031 [Guillardia theta CCMP2712]
MPWPVRALNDAVKTAQVVNDGWQRHDDSMAKILLPIAESKHSIINDGWIAHDKAMFAWILGSSSKDMQLESTARPLQVWTIALEDAWNAHDHAVFNAMTERGGLFEKMDDAFKMTERMLVTITQGTEMSNAAILMHEAAMKRGSEGIVQAKRIMRQASTTLLREMQNAELYDSNPSMEYSI